MICPNCNAQLPEEARFCPTCGTPVQQAADRTAAVSVTLGAPSPHGFQPTTGPLFPVDTRLDTFVITGVIGRGGSGVVYEAVDDFDGSTYALKVIPDANERAFASIRDEFAARKRINDFSNIVRAYQPRHVESPSGPIVVFPMERLASSLSEEIGDLESMSEAQREETILTTILPDILAGLRECHRAGILHLDIKPRNILYDRANQVYKVTDFGISRFRTDFGAGSVTEQPVQGTIAYAAPEQLSGGDLDERTDVYALGVLLNTLMYGSPGASGGESSSRLQTIIDNCVHRSPGRRYQSVDELLGALQTSRTGRDGNNEQETKVDTSGNKQPKVDRDAGIQRLAMKLSKIEDERHRRSFLGKAARAFSLGADPVDQRKAEAIKSFPLPSTRKELIEFLIAAAPNAGDNSLLTRVKRVTKFVFPDDDQKSRELIEAAWRQKCGELITKARVLLPADQEFERLVAELSTKYRI